MPAIGLEGVNGVSWGSHLCMCYRSLAQFIRVTASFIRTGLAENQLCNLITPPPLTAQEAREALAHNGFKLERYLSSQQLQIVSDTDCYLDNGEFNRERAVGQLRELSRLASQKGFSGVRVAGGPGPFASEEHRRAFMAYEHEATQLIHLQQFLVLCAYPIASCSYTNMYDIMAAHTSAFLADQQSWKTIGIGPS